MCDPSWLLLCLGAARGGGALAALVQRAAALSYASSRVQYVWESEAGLEGGVLHILGPSGERGRGVQVVNMDGPPHAQGMLTQFLLWPLIFQQCARLRLVPPPFLPPCLLLGSLTGLIIT